MNITIDIRQFPELVKKLESLPTKARKKAMREPIKAIAKKLRNDLRARAPRRTGRFKKNIKDVKVKERAYEIEWAVGMKLPGGFHGHLLEFGHEIKTEKGGKSHGRVPGYPTFGPVFKENEDNYKKMFEKHVKQWINTVQR
ncbi:MAG: HK97 gp10 family phage protein [Gammaproteobacteria bacterium]|nr:HK97 gp10 family phage protein [Gammaproteobacteria bacterium]